MRSTKDDRTAYAIIRDEALRLFAERGPDAVTVRQIAAAAEVSPGLVVHHFGSKDGLRAVVDDHVLATFERIVGELTGPDALDPAAMGSISEAISRHLPADSPIPAYLSRLLLSDSDAGRALFRAIFAASRQILDAMVAAGAVGAGPDPDIRAAILVANDLAVLLLRRQLAETLGMDPLSGEGLQRWGRELLTIYSTGLEPK